MEKENAELRQNMPAVAKRAKDVKLKVRELQMALNEAKEAKEQALKEKETVT